MADVREPRFDPVTDQLMEEHRRISAAMMRLEAARDLPELLVRLDEFSALLVPHFSAETAPGGFFDAVRERAGHSGRLAELEREHTVLLGEVERLIGEARACLAGPVAAILKQAQVLTARLHDHEARESQIFLDAMYTDIGDHGG